MAILYLVRHAEADPQGGADPGLSALGRQQAAQLAARLSALELAEIVHSPMLRAAQTAQLITAQLHLPTTPSELLRDRTPLPAQGEWNQYPSQYHDWLNGTPLPERDPGGQAITQALDHFSTSRSSIALITHAFVIGWFVRAALDAPAWRWIGLQPANCSVSVIRYENGLATLQAFNQR